MTCICQQCRNEFDVDGEPFEMGGVAFKPNVCNLCDTINIGAAHEKRLREMRAERQQRYADLCPKIYRDTDVERLPDRAKASEILAWQYGPRGFVAGGPTAQGKSRATWMRLRRAIVEEGVTVEAFTDGSLALAIAEAYGESSDAARALRNRLCTAGILFIDDFGKSKMTERVASELFTVIEHRTSNELPILITTNLTTKTTAKVFRDDLERLEPMLRRLREFCRGINFTPTEHGQSK
jgi:DNA replication protein DnaC